MLLRVQFECPGSMGICFPDHFNASTIQLSFHEIAVGNTRKMYSTESPVFGKLLIGYRTGREGAAFTETPLNLSVR